MATLSIQRERPFARGDESIRILLDGKDIGMLPKEGALVRELSAGTHKLQATMNGVRGRTQLIDTAGADEISLIVFNAKPKYGDWVDVLLFILISALPGSMLSGRGVWIRIGLYLLLLAIAMYRRRIRMKDFLRLEAAPRPAGQPATESAAI